MLAFLSLAGVFLSILLLFFNAGNNKSTLYLGLFFLFLSLYCFYQYILLYSKSELLISLFLVNIAIISSPLYLIGPMLFWYIRSVLTDDFKLKRKDLWHLLPLAVFFITALPNSFVPWHEKMEVARAVARDADFIQHYQATLFTRIFPVSVEFVIRPLLILGYTLWSVVIFINFLFKKKASTVLSEQQFMKKWLFLFLGFLLLLELTQISLVIRGFAMHFSEPYFSLNLIRILSAIGLIGLLISPFFFPAILYGMPRLPETLQDFEIAANPDSQLSDNYNKNQLRLENNYLSSIAKKVDTYMDEFQPYLQQDLNLSQVSVQTGVPVHHLGYFFKEIKKQPFHDYRNRLRVIHAKKLIAEGKTNQMTLEAIGLLSGFPNRNAFREAFLKNEGILPADYTARLN